MIIGTGANIQFLGVLISFIAVIDWAFMSVISRKISNKYSALTLTKVSMLIATVCNIPVSFLEVQVTHPLIQVDLGAVLGLVIWELFVRHLRIIYGIKFIIIAC